jgi:predicted Zn-dependent peptidase
MLRISFLSITSQIEKMKKKIYINMLIAFIASTMLNKVQAQEAFKVPNYTKFTLGNGLNIYLMEQHEVPTISFSAIIPAGAIYDGDKNGLASFTASGLQYGTKNFKKAEIEEQLDFLGASLNTYASKESAGLSAKFSKVDQDKVLPIIKEVLLSPVFNEEEFDKEKTRSLQQLERAKESPRNVIENYWNRFIYGDHPYANPVSGKPSTVKNITTQDLKNFYSQNYVPNGSAIAIVGDFNTSEMKAKISKLFKEWKKRNAERQSQGKVSPTDFLNPETEYAPVEVIGRRIKICEDCDQYLATKHCRECGCFMPLKFMAKVFVHAKTKVVTEVGLLP